MQKQDRGPLAQAGVPATASMLPKVSVATPYESREECIFLSVAASPSSRSLPGDGSFLAPGGVDTKPWRYKPPPLVSLAD